MRCFVFTLLIGLGSLGRAAAPVPGDERHLPKEAKYLLDLSEAQHRALIRCAEIVLRAKLDGRDLGKVKVQLRISRRELYRQRLYLIDLFLSQPEVWLRHELSFRQRAALWAMQVRLRNELQRAYDSGEAEKLPPEPEDPRDRRGIN
jgi:hypothetical protein